MKFIDTIKNGFDVINRNWQIILIQIGAMLASLAGFFVFVVIPLGIAFIIFGLDLTQLSRFDEVLNRLRDPSAIISKYFGLIIMVLTSFFVYLLLIMALGIFVFGGAIGSIGKSITERMSRFNFKFFMAEGKRLFFPLVWFTTVIGLIFIVLAFALGLLGGAISSVVSIAKEQDATLALFLGVFLSLIAFLVVLVVMLAVFSLTVYSAASIAMKGLRPVAAIKETVYYLYKNPDAFYMYCMVFGAYLIVSVMIAFLGYPMKYIPLIGPVLAIVYQISIYVIQSYLGFVMIASMFGYYYSATSVSIEVEASASAAGPIAGSSTRETDTFPPQSPSQGDIPPEKSQSEQV